MTIVDCSPTLTTWSPALLAQQQNGQQVGVASLAAMQMPIVEEGLEKAGPLIEEGAAKVEQEAPVIENEFATLTQKAKDLYPKLANKVDQLHHVIPKYLGGAKDGVLVKSQLPTISSSRTRLETRLLMARKYSDPPSR